MRGGRFPAAVRGAVIMGLLPRLVQLWAQKNDEMKMANSSASAPSPEQITGLLAVAADPSTIW